VCNLNPELSVWQCSFTRPVVKSVWWHLSKPLMLARRGKLLQDEN
jgi:hypothetical protein